MSVVVMHSMYVTMPNSKGEHCCLLTYLCTYLNSKNRSAISHVTKKNILSQEQSE